MKAYLMFRDRDLNPNPEFPFHKEILIQDLALQTLFNAMAIDQADLFDVVSKVVLSSLTQVDEILYRQSILKDCLKNPTIIRDMYNIAVETIETRRKHHLGSVLFNYPSTILYGSVKLMQFFVEMLKKLKNIADQHAEKFESEGFTTFFEMIKRELDDDYFTLIQYHLKELQFRDGVLISAQLTDGNVGTQYILRKPNDKKGNWVKRVFSKRSPFFSFSIHPRDEGGARALSELRDRGINLVANALAQSAEHILSFFNMLKLELSFYVGCLNLYDQLVQLGEPISFPQPIPAHERVHSFKGLYDICLALTFKRPVVGNDLNCDNKDLVIITGANQGGKSTFLRSIGLAQLMMQCGMFVPAEFFRANISENIFTHFKRKEDSTMKSGKLDEELSRMNDILDHITSNSMVLFNESFAATNEREGTEIARQIVSALVEKHMKVYFVTHLYEFAHGFYEKKMENVFFLRAERKIEGKRTYKVKEGEPLKTSFGEDLYKKIFGIGK